MEPSSELNELSYLVIGAAIEVHRAFGPGHLEVVYERALAIELEFQQVAFRRQVRIDLEYRGIPVGESIIDLLVQEALVVEIKAVERPHPVHRAQVLSYLVAGSYQLGLLINFNAPRLTDGVVRVIWNP